MLNKMRDILAKITRAGVVDEPLIKDIVRDVQRILITSDVNISLVQQLSKDIEKRAKEEKLPPGVSRKEHLIKIIYDEMVRILGGETHQPRLDRHKILLVGLYGSGKTTSVAKIARFYSKRGMKICAVTTDVWRPAAFEQLRQLGEQIKMPVFGSKDHKKPLDILKDAMPHAEGFDIVIVDSAGRDSLNKELLDEIKSIKDRLRPEETYLVISADIGQTASAQAKQFNDMVGLTGVIATKTDTSGKAGGALTACHIAKIPVCFITTGEKVEDFEVFDAKKFVSRLLGFPDLGELLKKVKEAAEETEFNPEDILKEEYNLKMFYKQLEATKKMGPLKKVFEMLGAGSLPPEMVETSEQKLKSYKYILNSMTKKELEEPELINSNRVKRIAKGSGRPETEVRELLKQFEMSRKMIQKIKKGKLRGLQGMMKQFGMGGAMPKLPTK
jgi:signal recognition particle subunit SRP54